MSCTCPYCNKAAELVTGAAIYPHRPDLFELRFWMCCACDAYVGCHRKGAYFYVGAAKIVSDGTLPLGRLANSELRKAKSETHASFDPLWKGGGMTRTAAYKWLAFKLGIPVSECHIGNFDLEQCKRAIQISDEVSGKAEKDRQLDVMFEARWGKAA